ncbi:hypothetical protein SAMN02745900_01181 [Pseudomonas sp. URIL14HWK12:I8]|uniref:hypothetical protein n=1 Tax=unclassified Pseudomonas TaxID=196821 RepID=UPI00048242C8|nr:MULTISPECIES: hypothetical protein [unclassified Pseudomonas]SNB63608.1 hypothetical protein SAMN02745900_01181 [Pseudomonas sp. URIL14HWK12:I8]
MANRTITPYEMGLSAALVLIGKALGSTPGLDLEGLIASAERLQGALPAEPKMQGGQGEHQAALSSLLQGLNAAR